MKLVWLVAWMLVSALVGAIVFVLPPTAEACDPDDDDGCHSAELSLAGTTIAADGVLVIETSTRDVRSSAASASVTDPGGNPVEGAFEDATEVEGLVLWRPAQSWSPGAGYTLEMTYECDSETASLVAEFTVDAQPLPPAGVPAFSVEEEITSVPSQGLADAVCCDGAHPSLDTCDDHWRLPDEGCVVTALTVELVVSVVIDQTALPASARHNYASRWPRGPAVPSWREFEWSGGSTDAPTCVTLSFIDLARRQSIDQDVCVGEGVDEPLGRRQHDPTDELAEMCEGTPYQCLSGLGWDRDDCQSWEGAQGCGCRAGTAQLTPGVVCLLVFLGLARRAPRSRRWAAIAALGACGPELGGASRSNDSITQDPTAAVSRTPSSPEARPLPADPELPTFAERAGGVPTMPCASDEDCIMTLRSEATGECCDCCGFALTPLPIHRRELERKVLLCRHLEHQCEDRGHCGDCVAYPGDPPPDGAVCRNRQCVAR
jgi:hypothetical protein